MDIVIKVSCDLPKGMTIGEFKTRWMRHKVTHQITNAIEFAVAPVREIVVRESLEHMQMPGEPPPPAGKVIDRKEQGQ